MNQNEAMTTAASESNDSHEHASSFARIWEILSASDKPLITSHANPDADAVSSVLAVADLLLARGKKVVPVVGDGDLPDTLVFLPGAERLRNPDDVKSSDFDAIFVVDCAELHRVGPLYRKHAGWFDGTIPMVSVDHHITNSGYGIASVVDATAAATCEILALMFESLDIAINPDVATCLAAGIYGDTLGLKTPSTTSRTLRVSANLVDAKADIMSIVDSLFRVKPFSTVRLWGHVLNRVQMLGPVVWTEITPQMLEESGAVSSEGEGIVNFIAGTREARVGILLYENPGGWRASLRAIADDIDVATLAQLYGGGGHSRAAGCTLAPGAESRDAFLKDIANRVAALSTAAQDS